MKSEPLIYIDVETQLTANEAGGWNPGKMGLSVAVVVSGNRVSVYKEKDIAELSKRLNSAKCVIGYNIIAFDFRVLEGYEGVDLKKVKCIDLHQNLESITGSRIMFTSLEKATLGTEQDIDGNQMVRFWKEGNVPQIIEGCCNDVLAIKAIHEYGRTNGEVSYYPKDSKRKKRVEVKW